MNKEEKLKVIREACIRANPNIKSTNHESTGNNLRCKNCGEPDSYENRGLCKSGSERPIRLADVLFALKQTGKFTLDGLSLVCYGYNGWNLLKDNLNNQSEETINFLYELLHV